MRPIAMSSSHSHLKPGLHALSNHKLGTPWPKVTQGLRALTANVDAGSSEVESLFEAMLEQKPRH